MSRYAHKIGAVFYVLWGIFHTYIGVVLLWQASTSGTPKTLATIGNALPPDRITTVNDPLVNGVLQHYAWNLVWFGLFAIGVAVLLNWKNSRTGYWFNLIVVSLTDLGFIGGIVLKGYITFAAGWTGPIFWVIAAAFTTFALRGTESRRAPLGLQV